jgi:hypothetical protein
MFKTQIIIDCHSLRPLPTICLLPDPPHFSLLSSFKMLSLVINCSVDHKGTTTFRLSEDYSFSCFQNICWFAWLSALKGKVSIMTPNKLWEIHSYIRTSDKSALDLEVYKIRFLKQDVFKGVRKKIY